MRLTALDIREQQFRRVMRGLDPDEVVTFLGAVATEYELLVSENRDLRQRLLDLEHQIGEFRSMEKALRDTLLTAERVTAETRENAHKEAELILRQAEVAAQQSTAHISSEILQKHRELSELQRKKREYLLSVRALAVSHLEMIESDSRALENEVSAASAAAAPPQPRSAVQEVPLAAVNTQANASPAHDAVVPPIPEDLAVPSELPMEVGGVIPSAVSLEEVDVAASQEDGRSSQSLPLIAPPENDWAEAAFDPRDLVPREAEPAAMTDRTPEQFRRGVEPHEPLPSLLRGPGAEAPANDNAVPSAPNPLPEAPRDGDNQWPTHAVRPDGSRGE